MFDQCKNCELRGNYPMCIKAECDKHASWYAQILRSERDQLKNRATCDKRILDSHIYMLAVKDEELKKVQAELDALKARIDGAVKGWAYNDENGFNLADISDIDAAQCRDDGLAFYPVLILRANESEGL